MQRISFTNSTKKVKGVESVEDNFFSISDIAEKLQYSKTYIYRIYNKNKKQLKQYTKIIQGVTYLSIEGFNLIESILKSKDDTIQEEADNEVAKDPQQELINALKEEIEFLREQLRNQTEIVKREQQLRMTESQNLLILEQHIRETDEKISLWREESLQKNKDNKVGFFNRFFKK